MKRAEASRRDAVAVSAAVSHGNPGGRRRRTKRNWMVQSAEHLKPMSLPVSRAREWVIMPMVISNILVIIKYRRLAQYDNGLTGRQRSAA